MEPFLQPGGLRQRPAGHSLPPPGVCSPAPRGEASSLRTRQPPDASVVPASHPHAAPPGRGNPSPSARQNHPRGGFLGTAPSRAGSPLRPGSPLSSRAEAESSSCPHWCPHSRRAGREGAPWPVAAELRDGAAGPRDARKIRFTVPPAATSQEKKITICQGPRPRGSSGALETTPGKPHP